MAWQERWRSYIERHPRTSAGVIVGMALFFGAYDRARLSRARSLLPDSDWVTIIAFGAVVGLGILLIAALWWVLFPHLGIRWPRWASYVVAFPVLLTFGSTHPRHGPDAIRDSGDVALVMAVDVVFIAMLGLAAMRRWRTPAPAGQ